jgi:arginine utilization regulatory protein
MEQNKTESKLSNEEMAYCMKIALNTVYEGMMLVSKMGVIEYYNHQMGQLEGLRSEDVVGKKITEIYRVNEDKSEHHIVAKTKKPILDRYQNYYASNNQKILSVASTYPIIKEGELVATYSIARNTDKMANLLKKTEEIEQLHKIEALPSENNTRYTFNHIITKSEKMTRILEKAIKFSKYNSNILLYGETGVGKEIFAQGIHNCNSINRHYPFVGINCSAIPENLLESSLFGTVKGAFTGAENQMGLIEKAGMGTLFLDEINSMPIALQAKILRVIQEKNFRRIGGTEEISAKCRIISSTNIEPKICLSENLIRKDLYYRISTNILEIPPLHERKADIPHLIQYFMKIYGSKYGLYKLEISDNVLEILKNYYFPGNVRELENIIESAITLAGESQRIDESCLPENFAHLDQVEPIESESLVFFLQNAERDKIVEILEANDWNISKSAKNLKIARQNLQYRMKKLNIKKVKSHTNW